jgi:hypothetical protein
MFQVICLNINKKINFMKKVIVCLALCLTSALSAEFAVNFLGILADNASSPKNAMPVGIIVDTGDNGFKPGEYTSFDISNAGYLSTVSGVTDDYFVRPQAGQKQATYNTEGLDGALEAFKIDNSEIVVPGKKFALVWLVSDASTAGNYYGVITDNKFVTLGAGATDSLEKTNGDQKATYQIAASGSGAWVNILGGNLNAWNEFAPWYMSPEMGWLYIDVNSTATQFYVYNNNLSSWMYVDSQWYPWFYIYGTSNDWYYYWVGTGWFQKADGSGWLNSGNQ